MPENDELKKCDPREIALKSFFLGPQAENAPWVCDLFFQVLNQWIKWRKSVYPEDGVAISEADQNSIEFLKRRHNFEKFALELVTRFESEVPKFSPRYVGHMFSEISLPALMGHVISLLHNPNNISGESSRVGIQIEEEAVHELLKMVGFTSNQGTGHFTSGGTIANLEALTRAYSRYSLWLAAGAASHNLHRDHTFDPFLAAHFGWDEFDKKNINSIHLSKWSFTLSNPLTVVNEIEKLSLKKYLGPVILVPENMHYSWKKGCQFLGLGRDSLWPIQLDRNGTILMAHLILLLDRAKNEGRPVLMVVSVVGTTELGGIDPVDKVQSILDDLKKESGIHIWHHVDAAYGGFFRTLDLDKTKILKPASINALSAIPKVTSITLDPHKLGYVPYASGAFLTKLRRDYYFSAFDDAPYIDFDESIDRGPFTLEGSRSAAGAVATWMTSKTMGLNPEGYGLLLERTTRICKELEVLIKNAKLPIQIAPGCETNVLCFTCAESGDSITDSNLKTLKVFEGFSPKNNGAFIVSKTTLKWSSYQAYLDQWTTSWSAKKDTSEITLIRMCMMNPFFGSVETDINYSESFVKALRELFTDI